MSREPQCLGDETEFRLNMETAFAETQVLETAVVTGVLASQQQAMDIKIEQFSMSVYGKEFIKDLL